MTPTQVPGQATLVPLMPLAEVVWWMAVQGVYARSIGASFAKPANDIGSVRLGWSKLSTSKGAL